MRKKIFILCSVLLVCFVAGAQKYTVVIGQNESPFVWTSTDGFTVVESCCPSSFKMTKTEGGSIVPSEGMVATNINGVVTAIDKVQPADVKAWFDQNSGNICITLGDNLKGNYIARLFDSAGKLVAMAPVDSSFTNINSHGAGVYILSVMGEDGSFVCSCKLIAR